MGFPDYYWFPQGTSFDCFYYRTSTRYHNFPTHWKSFVSVCGQKKTVRIVQISGSFNHFVKGKVFIETHYYCTNIRVRMESFQCYSDTVLKNIRLLSVLLVAFFFLLKPLTPTPLYFIPAASSSCAIPLDPTK